MERLTIRNSDGSVSQPTATTIQAVFEKLAAYEDTGLSPRQITMAMDTLKLCDSIGVMRMNEILDAERDGRLVVLPCKVGDVAWEIDYGCTIGSDDLCYIPSEACGDCEFVSRSVTPRKVKDIADAAWLTRRWGKTVFLTREEAEKALEVSENEPI